MKTIVSVVSLTCMVFQSSAFAWESDFHYGLTRWLAFKAGFSYDHAGLIGQGALVPDLHVNSAVYTVWHYACLRRDQEAAEHVRDQHFPSFALAKPPSERYVDPDSSPAHREIQKEVYYTHVGNLEFSLRKLGETLHPLQDSWSHHGVPDPPALGFLTCDGTLAYGHPKTRGGWMCHAADLTYLHANDKDTLNAAMATYKYLVVYLKRHPQFRANEGIEPDTNTIQEFAHLHSREGKKQWFKAQEAFAQDDDASFGWLDDISLPKKENESLISEVYTKAQELITHCPEDTPSATVSADDATNKFSIPVADRDPKPWTPQSANPSRTVVRFFNDFLKEWMLGPGDERLLQFIDEDAVAVNTASLERPPIEKQTFVHNRFLIWRLNDHGLATRLGHGRATASMAPEVHQSLNKFLMSNTKTLWIAKKDLRDILITGKNDLGYTLHRLESMNGNERYAVVLKFRHAPHDSVILTAEKMGAGWQIIALNWSVDH